MDVIAFLITAVLVVLFFRWVVRRFPAPTFLSSVKRAADTLLAWFFGLFR